jgi:hypothetical protein
MGNRRPLVVVAAIEMVECVEWPSKIGGTLVGQGKEA